MDGRTGDQSRQGVSAFDLTWLEEPTIPDDLAGHRRILAQGGVPIKIGESTIGAVAVSGAPGGDKDAACANAGIAKASDKLK